MTSDSDPKRAAHSALAIIPQGVSLVAREPQVASWVDGQTDPEQLRDARALLASWRVHAERGSAERDAAIRLDIRCERRLGQLPEAAPIRPAGRRSTSQAVRSSHAEEQALSRARALAAIPPDLFEKKLAEPKPSRDKLVTFAIMGEPKVDPVSDQAMRLFHAVRHPERGSWPDSFDLSLLDERTTQTGRHSQESWRSWCDRWDEALAAVPKIRRVK